MIQNNMDAQDAPKPLLHPLDPSVEQEYDILTRSWKNQLIQDMPVTTNADYIRIAWIRLMDHYLDQHWLDSKQMLQCAQAWSSRDSLSMSEAVHTMSTLSLKSMQRSLDARQELLSTLGDPEVMMAFGVSPSVINGERAKEVSSMAALHNQQRFSHETHEEDEEHEIHAPLLARHTASPIQELLEAYSEQLPEEGNQENGVWEDLTDIIFDKKDQNQNNDKTETAEEEEREEEEEIVGSRLTIGGKSTSEIIFPSDRPNILHHSNSVSNTNANSNEKAFSSEKHNSQQSIHSVTPLKQENEQKDVDESSICSSKSGGSSQLGNGSPWKSWFLSDQGALENDSVHRKLTAYSSSSDFANEKVETDAPIEIYNSNNHPSSIHSKSFLNYGHLISPQYDRYPFKMVRSESSISAFRPISNNLAPRCQPTRHRRNSSSTTATDSGDRITQKTTATINKSKSFPTKAALTASISSSPPPLPNKERHFMLRSIVGKKASLSKLFGVKKSLSSTSIS